MTGWHYTSQLPAQLPQLQGVIRAIVCCRVVSSRLRRELLSSDDVIDIVSWCVVAAIWIDPINDVRPLDDIQLCRFLVSRDVFIECIELDVDLLDNLEAAGGCLTSLQRSHIETLPSRNKIAALLDMMACKSVADFRSFVACMRATNQLRLVTTLLTENAGIHVERINPLSSRVVDPFVRNDVHLPGENSPLNGLIYKSSNKFLMSFRISIQIFVLRDERVIFLAFFLQAAGSNVRTVIITHYR